MGKTFARIHICVAGDFHGEEEKFKQWTEANGGKYSKELDAGVTHLITSKAVVRKGHSKVKAAKRMNKVKIVTASWLEDSLVASNRRPKPEGPYLLVESRKKGKGRASRRKTVEEKAPESSEKNAAKKTTTRVQDVITEMETSGYHHYKDESNFAYHVKLVRPSLTSNRKQRYSIMLFESESTPKMYATFAAFTAVGKGGEHYLAPSGSSWELANRRFRNFFKQKTGKKWEDRDDGKVPSSKKDVHGEELPQDEGWFTYEGVTGVTRTGNSVMPTSTTSEPIVGDAGDVADMAGKGEAAPESGLEVQEPLEDPIESIQA